MIISSCTKDEIEAELDNTVKVSFVDDLANYVNETNTIIRNDPDSTEIFTPSSAELQDLADYLQASEDSDIWMPEFVAIYGYPVWNRAVKSTISGEGVVITLPLIKNDLVIGVLKYINTPDIIHAYFRGYNHIVNIPNLEYSQHDIGRAKILAMSFIYFQYSIDGSYNEELVKWLRVDQSEGTMSNLTTTIRAELFCWDEILEYLEEVGPDPNDPLYDEDADSNGYNHFEVAITHCIIIGGPSGGSNIPAGNINPDINIDPDDNPAGPNQEVEDCLERLNANMRAKIKNAVTEIENTYGNKICFDEQDVEGTILFLKYEGLIDCNNSAAATIVKELERRAKRNANRFDKALEDIRNSNISDPCNPELIPADIVTNALAAMQANGECGIDGLESGLSTIDYIDFGTLPSDCECLTYIVNKLKTGSEENWICNMISQLSGAEAFYMDFDVSASHTAIHYAASGSGGTMQIPLELCDEQSMSVQEGLEASGKLIHEFLHAYVFQQLQDRFPNSDFDFGKPETWKESWNVMLREYHEVGPDAQITDAMHYQFYVYFKQFFNDALHDINNGKGDPSDYEYFTNIIINTANVASHPQWGVRLNLQNFNNNSNLTDWNSIGGFNLDCI